MFKVCFFAGLEVFKNILFDSFYVADFSLLYQLAQFYFSPALLGVLEANGGIGKFLLTLLILGGGQAFLSGLSNYIDCNRTAPIMVIDSRIKEEITHKISNTSYPNFLTEKFKNRTGQAFEATGEIATSSEHVFYYFLQKIILFAIYLYFLNDIHPILGLITAALSIIMFFYNRWAYAWGQRHRDEESEVWRKWGYVHDNMVKLPFIKELKLFGMSDWIESIFRDVWMISAGLSVKREKFFAWRGVVNLVTDLGRTGFALYFLISMAMRGELTAARFLLLFNAIERFSAEVGGIFDAVNKIRESCLKVNNLMEFITYPEPFKFEDGEPVPRADEYEIKLENVSYTYPGADKKILDGFNLTIHKGEKLAMVGLNGAGKTTVVKLICGFLDPDEGRVLLNGRDVRDFNRRDYYSLFSAVFQQFSIIDSTVAQNIAQTVEDIDYDKLNDCIEKAGLTKALSELPKGLETHLGRDIYEDGVLLSGGQTQRLILARALYKSAPILVLDEPTAALDPIAENDIYMKYNRMCAGKTSVFISHRFASTRFCDRVVYIKDGRAAEIGTHEELIRLNGDYAKLFEVQARYYKDGDISKVFQIIRKERRQMFKKKDKEKYELSFKESLAQTWKAVKLLHSLAPGEMELDFTDDAIQVIHRYFNIYIMALLIDELANARRPERLLWLAVGFLINMLIYQALHYLLFHIKQCKGNFRGEKKQRLFDRKLAELDYVDAERQEIRDKYFKIQQDHDWLGYGIDYAYQLLEGVIIEAVSIICGTSLSIGFVFNKVTPGTPSEWFLNSPLFIILVFILVAGCTKLTNVFAFSARSIQEKHNDSSALFNRINRHTQDIQKDELRALDMRIYNQGSQLVAMRRDAIEKGYVNELRKISLGSVGLLYVVVRIFAWLPDSILFLFVGIKAMAGAFGVGLVTQYVASLTNISDSVLNFTDYYLEFRINAPYIKKAFEFLELPNKMYQGSLTTEKRSDRQYDVEFKDVSFKYPAAERWALRHVNIKFKVGTRLAVVGENGSGKTTFIKLLCRLYGPQEGEILLNGIDIKKYNPKDYMGVFSVVFQDYFLLSQPLGENVACAKEYDRALAEKCLRDAGFGERLDSLPNGLDTYVYKEYEQDGVQFSGGEAQKIAIARALYKNAPFIILDEPTAALDPIAEADIYSQFDEITGDKTAIYISHRLSSCRFCDEIAVFDDGKIVELGTHDGLLASNGKYKALWEAQAGYYAEEQLAEDEIFAATIK